MSANSFLASGDFCHLLISFENSLDHDLNPNIVFLIDFFEKVNFEKSQQTTTKA